MSRAKINYTVPGGLVCSSTYVIIINCAEKTEKLLSCCLMRQSSVNILTRWVMIWTVPIGLETPLHDPTQSQQETRMPSLDPSYSLPRAVFNLVSLMKSLINCINWTDLQHLGQYKAVFTQQLVIAYCEKTTASQIMEGQAALLP